MKVTYIYTLTDPRTNEIRYVSKIFKMHVMVELKQLKIMNGNIKNKQNGNLS